MASVQEIQEEIRRLKKETKTTILVHAYQSQEILEIADHVGDSYGLALLAKKEENPNMMMCGVRFMAETCKILCPDKTVYLPNPSAGCPMAEQLNRYSLIKLKEEYPEYTIVAYINTSAELKTETDVCVTSSCAYTVCKNIENDKILFIPDPNLGSYIAKKLPEKQFKFVQGGCPHHAAITKEDVLKAKQAHPKALLLVHPECQREVVELADFVGSTTEIMKFAKESTHQEFLIGTENSIVEHLQFDCMNKIFYPVSTNLVCPDMKATTLMDIYLCLKGISGEKIELDPFTLNRAKSCLDEMIRLQEK